MLNWAERDIESRVGTDKRSYAFNLGNKVIDHIYEREQRYTNPKWAKAIDKVPDVIKRYMLEAFIEGYIIAKEKSEERIIWEK